VTLDVEEWIILYLYFFVRTTALDFCRAISIPLSLIQLDTVSRIQQICCRRSGPGDSDDSHVVGEGH